MLGNWAFIYATDSLLETAQVATGSRVTCLYPNDPIGLAHKG